MNAGWQQLRFVLAASDIEVAEALLRLAEAEAIDLADPDDTNALLEPAPGCTPLWPRVTVRALFPAVAELAPLVGVLRDTLPSAADIAVMPLDEAHWRRALHIGPQRKLIGRRLALDGPDGDSVPGRVLLKLNFGMAFGTGEHPTTAACLDWIERELPPNLRVLDYGCGSGVLALAALVLGAARAWAIDIEPQALTATRANAALNRCEDRLWVGLPEALPTTQVDCIAANILARTLIDLADEFARRLVPQGRLLASGVLEAQVDDLIAVLQPHFEDFVVVPRDGWIRLSARRNAEAAPRS
jgi:ribosomal protein L11 methyltransferase